MKLFFIHIWINFTSNQDQNDTTGIPFYTYRQILFASENALFV